MWYMISCFGNSKCHATGAIVTVRFTAPSLLSASTSKTMALLLAFFWFLLIFGEKGLQQSVLK